MPYGIPFKVETDHLPLQNIASLSDTSNRVQRWVDFLNAYVFKIKHRSKNTTANADVLSRLPLPATSEDIQPRYRLTDPSDLDVYFVGASGIHPSSLRTSSDSCLGGLANASVGMTNTLVGLTATPDDVFSSGGGWSSAFPGNGARFGAVRQFGGTL